MPTDSCEAESAKPLKWALAYPESAGSGTKMPGCDVAVTRKNQAGCAVTFDDAAERVGTEVPKVGIRRTSIRELVKAL